MSLIFNALLRIIHFGFGSISDPHTNEILYKIEKFLFPVLYSIIGLSLVFVGIRFRIKINSNPENRSDYIKNMLLIFCGIAVFLLVVGIAHLIVAWYLGIL